MSGRQILMTRQVTRQECPWLNETLEEGELLYPYTGYTYGCISHDGSPASRERDETPFFEIPNDSFRIVGVD